MLKLNCGELSPHFNFSSQVSPQEQRQRPGAHLSFFAFLIRHSHSLLLALLATLSLMLATLFDNVFVVAAAEV